MTPTLQVNLRGWQAAARALQETSRRSLPDFLNGQALRVVIEAVRQTEKANAAKIAHKLGQTGYAVKAVKSRKTGRTSYKRGRMTVATDSFASRILQARYRKTGDWGIGGKTMDERVRNYINSVMRSVAFIKSGWIPARQALFRVVKMKPSGTSGKFMDAKQYGKPKGYAIPAAGNIFRNLTAVVANKAISPFVKFPSKSKGNPRKVAEEGLAKALEVCRKDMVKTLLNRLQPALNRMRGRP